MTRSRFVLLLIIAWTALLVVSALWDWDRIKESVTELALATAQSNIEKDILYRRWAALHGGVYVPPTEKYPPNPYLAFLPDRDVTTTSGQALTLTNPAYMTRQVYELAAEDDGVQSHITSLKPLRPENKPDDWEARALLALQAGAKETSALMTIGGKPYLRLMRPLYTEAPCLKCHGIQGYKVGDIRGGISVAVPFGTYSKIAETQRQWLLLSHVTVGLLGLIGLWLGGRYLRRSEEAMQEALQISERQTKEQQLLLSSLAEGVIGVDSRGSCIFANPVALAILGHEADEVIGQDQTQLCQLLAVDGEPFPPEKGPIGLTIKDGKKREIDAAFLRNGRLVQVHLAATPMREGSTILGAVVAFEDITERKQMEIALRASEERHRLLFNSSRDALLTLGPPTWKFTSANQAMLDMFGAASLAEFTSLGPGDISPERQPDGQPSSELAQDLMVRTLHEGSQIFEWGCRRLNGERFFADILLTRMQIGTEVFIQATIRDISERKRIEAELEQHSRRLEELVAQRTAELTLAEARTRLILYSSADGIYGVDAQGLATFINPAACTLLGYSADDVIGRSIHDLIHHSHADGRPLPVADCPMIAALSGKEVVRDERNVFWHADGHPIPVSYAAHPMWEGERVVGAVVSFFDISAQKAAEAEAERLVRLKHDFLANMSHEIRTPLNAVLGFARIGLLESTDSHNADRFSRIAEAGQRLLGLVNDILDFSRMETGQFDLEVSDFDVHELIAQSAGRIRERARAKGLALRVEPAPDLPAACRGDGMRLRQALANILDNAVKFTHAGGITLSACYEATTLIIRVVDSGIGMGEEQRNRLFQPFEQGDGSKTRRFGGTGLGLALSQRLMTLMGGEIRVTSAAGQGSTFELRLPCAAVAGAVSDVRAEPEPEPEPEPAEPEAHQSALETVPDMARIDAVLGQLEALLTANDTLSSVVFSENRALLLHVPGPLGRQLGLRIEAYDYPGALVTLREMRASRAFAAGS